MEKKFWTLGIFAFGVLAVWLGIMVRMGKLRWLFFGGTFPILAPVGAFLIAIPTGLGIITIGLMLLFPEYKDPLTIPMLFFGLIAVVLGFWTPSWLLPAWLYWLMKNYEPVLGQIFEEARKMGIKEWEAQTRTQAELEAWADSVVKKHGWRRLQ